MSKNTIKFIRFVLAYFYEIKEAYIIHCLLSCFDLVGLTLLIFLVFMYIFLDILIMKKMKENPIDVLSFRRTKSIDIRW